MNSADREPITKHIRPKTARSRQRQPHHTLEHSDEPPPPPFRPVEQDRLNEASPSSPQSLSKPAAAAATTSILRRSKYSTPPSATSAAARVTPENASAAAAFCNGDDGAATEAETIVKKSPNNDSDSLLAVQDFVVEKRRRKKETTNSVTQKPANSTSAKTTAGTDPKLYTIGDVEGYVPRTTGTYPMKVSTSTSTTPDLADTKAVKRGMERPATSDNSMSDDEDNDKPKHSGDEDDDNGDDPLVFNSLADLMSVAGTLPNQEDKSNPVMIEAELQFSCMDRDEFQQEQQQVFYGKQNIFDNDNTDESTSPRSDDDGNDEEGEDDDDEDDLWDVLGLGGSMDGEDEEEPAPPPRAFLQLWTALSQWVTPEAAEFVAAIQAFERGRCRDNESTTGSTNIPAQAFVAPKALGRCEPPSDVALSRCAGLMAALRLHTARCWHLLNIGRSNELRTVEMTLADLLRCFDYSRPMPPSLDLALTRALACVLLHTVAPVVGVSLLVGEKGTATTTTTEITVPKPCAVLGMTADEYTYLVRSAVVTFGKTSMEDSQQ